MPRSPTTREGYRDRHHKSNHVRPPERFGVLNAPLPQCPPRRDRRLWPGAPARQTPPPAAPPRSFLRSTPFRAANPATTQYISTKTCLGGRPPSSCPRQGTQQQGSEGKAVAEGVHHLHDPRRALREAVLAGGLLEREHQGGRRHQGHPLGVGLCASLGLDHLPIGGTNDLNQQRRICRGMLGAFTAAKGTPRKASADAANAWLVSLLFS